MGVGGVVSGGAVSEDGEWRMEDGELSIVSGSSSVDAYSILDPPSA
jgi:hypothetical protein